MLIIDKVKKKIVKLKEHKTYRIKKMFYIRILEEININTNKTIWEETVSF